MRRLYELCQSPTKTWKPLPHGDHNSSVLEKGYFEAIQVFMESLGSHGDYTMKEDKEIESQDEWKR